MDIAFHFSSGKSICSGIKHSNPALKKTPKKLDSELKEPAENGKVLSRKELPKQSRGDKDPLEKNSKEQRVLLLPYLLA